MIVKEKKLTPTGITLIRTRPNTKIVSNILSHNSPTLSPCSLAETSGGLLVISDPPQKLVEIFHVHQQLTTALSVKIIELDGFGMLFDCCMIRD